jgi:hypothetical protein
MAAKNDDKAKPYANMAKKDADTTTLLVSMPVAAKRKLKLAAAKRDTSASALIREFIETL